MFRPRPLQMTLQLVHLVVRKHPDNRPTQPRTIDQAGMSELIKYDNIFLASERSEGSERSRIAARKTQRRLSPLELSELLLEPQMRGQCSAHKARSRTPEPILVDGSLGGGAEKGFPGEPEVIVRREIDKTTPSIIHERARLRLDFAQLSQQRLLLERIKFFLKLAGHVERFWLKRKPPSQQ